MKTNDVKVAVSHFLDLVVNGRGDEEENVQALEVALDMLAWIQHVVEPSLEHEHPDAPPREYDKMREIIAQQFPSFGSYRSPTNPHEQNGETATVVGDAVHDLADIALELYEVAWRFQNSSEADALWSFTRSYKERWRTQLRILQWYMEWRRRNGT